MDNFLKPKPLNYYQEMARPGVYKVDLTADQAAAILKAHDHGIAALESDETALIDQVMSILKDEIWP